MTMNIVSLFSFLDGAMFLLSHLVTVHCSNFHVNTITGSGIMAVFVYKKLTRKWEVVNTPSEFCPISGDWDKSGIPNFAQMYLMKSYWMLQNARVTAITVSELLRRNKQGVKVLLPPPRLGSILTSSFGSIMPKKGTFDPKQKKWISLLNLAYLN